VDARTHGEDRPLAVVVGSSSARAGLPPTALDAADRSGRRWLNLAGTGSSFDELRYTFAPLFTSDLDAEVVVLAIHPGWIAGRLVGDPAFDTIMISESSSRRSWILFHRGRLAHVARTALDDARIAVLRALGVRASAIHAPAANPWTEEPPMRGRLDPGRDRGQLAMWQRKRWFDPRRFEEAEREIADLVEVIAGCRAAGRRVVVVLMPESSELRGAMPVEADAALRRALARVGDPPPLVDLRAEIADALFADHIHLNEQGAKHLAAILVDRMAAL